MVVSLPGLTSQMVGSGSGSSGTLATKLPPREDLECDDGPPCCLRTALPWWPPALPLMAVTTPLNPPPTPEEVATDPPGCRPATTTAGAVNEADGRKEEEDEEADREGKGSTGVAVAVAIVDVRESLTTAASRDEAEMAAIDGDGDCDGE